MTANGDETVGEFVERVSRLGSTSVFVAPWPRGEGGWQPIGHTTDGLAYGWSNYEDEIDGDDTGARS